MQVQVISGKDNEDVSLINNIANSNTYLLDRARNICEYRYLHFHGFKDL